MQQTEETIRLEARKVMKDFNRVFYEHLPIEVIFFETEEVLKLGTYENVWYVKVPVPDDQWNKGEADPGEIILYIYDDTCQAFFYMDGSMGRPILFSLIKNAEGKYERDKML
jgi:hypothetical protein